MNIYYAPPSQIYHEVIELIGQEAKHASKVMRAREGDRLTVVDGEGGWYEGVIARIFDENVQVRIQESKTIDRRQPKVVLAMGIIKKRDRLEFAVEKAVELGAAEIALFRSERTVKENVRMDRLQSKVLSATKQSLRAWRPEVRLFDSPSKVLDHYGSGKALVAHEKVDPDKPENNIDVKRVNSSQKLLLMIGPEGGFSADEVAQMTEDGAEVVTLGEYRLRAETAAVAFLSQFL